VQLTALLAALLEKTGTSQDLVEIEKRAKQYQKRMEEIQEAKLRALQKGQVWMETDEDQAALNNDSTYHPDKQQTHTKQQHSRQPWSPILIVVPSSITMNWVQEFSTWGHFATVKYAGSKENKDRVMAEMRYNVHEIMLCTNALFARPEHMTVLQKIPWKLIVIDEFHEFRNVDSMWAKNLRNLREYTPCPVIGLTGTLMQNNHKELWNLIDLVEPNYLGDYRTFQSEVETPIKHARYVFLFLEF
jgi:SNF2 family DNA or RNA helicase